MTKLTYEDIVANINNLPSLPTVVIELMRNLSDNDADTHTIASKLGQDQALAAKLLRLANSSFYGLQSRVTSILQATSILGVDSVRMMVVAATVIDRFSGNQHSSLSFHSFWRHSIGTALCAKALARKCGCNQDEAFIAGLLHDIGRLVLVTYAAQAYDAVIDYRDDEDCHLFEAEQAILGVDHMMAGRVIMAHWKFPPQILEAVLYHHGVPDDSSTLIQVVHLADCIAHALDLSSIEDDLVPPLSDDAWRRLALAETDIMEVFQETERQFEEACSILVTSGVH
jgi:putative nucleotidyltransferase with HDIG domain